MGAVQFALKGDDKKKKRLPYNEKQRIYKEQMQVLMTNFISSSVFNDDILKLISGKISEKEIDDIIYNYSKENSKCKIEGLAYPRESILTYATGTLIQNNRLIEKIWIFLNI